MARRAGEAPQDHVSPISICSGQPLDRCPLETPLCAHLGSLEIQGLGFAGAARLDAGDAEVQAVCERFVSSYFGCHLGQCISKKSISRLVADAVQAHPRKGGASGLRGPLPAIVCDAIAAGGSGIKPSSTSCTTSRASPQRLLGRNGQTSKYEGMRLRFHALYVACRQRPLPVTQKADPSFEEDQKQLSTK